MSLPDLTRLFATPHERLRAIGARLTEVGIAGAYEEIAAIGGGLFEPAFLPLRRRHLRRADGPAHRAARMLCADDPVNRDAAAEALGAATLDEMCAAGLLVETDGGLVSPLRLRAHEGVLFFADHLHHGGEAVMGAGPLTGVLLRASLPARRIGRALDLGCGAGLVALLFSRVADHVVATDISERAVGLSRVNAALNGVTNIDVRRGDLFETVPGEHFDRVASQPPFFPAPESAAGQTYSQGGRRGDELSLRVLAGVTGHLTPRGRAVIVAEWPMSSEEPLTTRLRGALGADASVLSIEADGPDCDAFTIGDKAFAHPDFGAAFAAEVVALREHLGALGVTTMRSSVTVVEPARAGGGGWTHAAEVADIADAAVDGAVVDSLCSTQELLLAGREALLGARLALPPGAVLFAAKDGYSRVLFEGGGASGVRLDREVHRILEMVDASANVGAAVKRYTKESSGPRGAATERFVAAVTQSLAAGLLVVAKGTEGAA
ncbi:MAG: methyltransferase [Polyangiaceae bacterium]